MKKIISLLLCMSLVIGLIPGVFAAEGDSYVALGDSITAGTALNEGEPAFPEILARNNGYVLTNLGVNGQTADGMLEALSTGEYDELLTGAKLITITTGGNDVMDALYELMAEAYNLSYDPDITADDVVVIMSNSEDPRWKDLCTVGLAILSGDVSTGTPGFADREELQAEIDNCIANLKLVMAYIRERNPEAMVIINTQYNPYKSFSGRFNIIKTSVNSGAKKLNAAITAHAEECGYLVADVYTAFFSSTENLCNAVMDPMNMDFHPNALGHEMIAKVIQEVIDSNQPIVNPFTDVVETDYFYDSVLWAVSEGVTTGSTATTFVPFRSCTRAETITFLWRAAGKPEPLNRENPFTDVIEGQFYYDAVLWAVENGITNGITADTFRPNMTCNRGQVVTFLWRAAGKPAANSVDTAFTDLVEGQFYYDAVLWAVENGITNGISATTFCPNSVCNRAQVVTFLYRAD